nr:hypothetical protein [Candidatus Sigynarchaeum springense]
MGKKKDKPDAASDGAGGDAVLQRKKKEPKQAALDIGSVDGSPAATGTAVPFIAPVSIAKPAKPARPAKQAKKESPSSDQADMKAQVPPSAETKPAETPPAVELQDETRAEPAAEPLASEGKPPAPAGDQEVSASEGEEALMRALESGEVGSAKFWQKNDYFRSLLDPDVIDKIDFAKYDLAKLLSEFFNEMFKEEYIDFKVSGIAVHAAAKIYRHKITQVLEQQAKEEEERKKEALRRNIPSTISQPLRAGRAIATQEDFMNSMRAAIIEVMRKREKQAQKIAKQQAAGLAKAEEAKKIRMKKMLPESIKKAMLGKERIEDTFQRWLEIIYEGIKNSPDKQVSYFHDLKPRVEKKDRYGFRFGQARLFLTLMFLRNRDKIDVLQEEELADMYVKKP